MKLVSYLGYVIVIQGISQLVKEEDEGHLITFSDGVISIEGRAVIRTKDVQMS